MLLEQIKTALRITNDKLNSDIQHHIEACFADMRRVGVHIPDSVDNIPLLITAVELYVKSEYDYLEKGTQFRAAYEKLRDAMSLCEEYSE